MSLNDLPERIKADILKRDEYAPKPDYRISITELLGCLRKSYYRRKDPRDISLDTAWWFYRGNLFDREWTRMFKRNQVRVTHRIWSPPITITGFFDFEDDDGAIADLKTIGDLYYVEKNGPKPEHVNQVKFYCFCEGKNLGRIYYLSFKDLLKFDIVISEDDFSRFIKSIESRAEELYRALTNDAPVEPPEGYSMAFWECKYCEYHDDCWNEKVEAEDGE